MGSQRVGCGVQASFGRTGAALAAVLAASLLGAGLGTSPAAGAPASRDGQHSAGRDSAGQGSAGTTDATASPTPEVEAHDTAELVAATQALTAAQAELVRARADLASAQDAVAAARAADLAAQTQLDLSAQAEQRASRDLAAVRTRLTSHETDLGRLARAAYQSHGVLGEWALVLDAETPHQLADRLATLQSVASAGNAVIADLERDRADLTNAQSHFAAAHEAQLAARESAHQALLDKVADEAAASAAEQKLTEVVATRAAALATAQVAASADNVRYQTMLVQSGSLAQRIIGMAGKLAKTKHPPAGTGHFDRPGRGVVTSPYGPRMHPILHYVKVHTGIDFSVADGVAYAADDGVVLLTEPNVAYGNMTVIDHGTVGGVHLTTLYAHQAAFGVQPGDRVVKGQPIGVIGDTGYATGPHLHFEVRVNGSPVDPAPFLTDAPPPPVLPGGGRPHGP